jgi:hypothetical protein
MKKFIPIVVIAAVCMSSATQTALAIKPFDDAWREYYLKETKDEDLKKLAGEAKCNICHVQGEKKTVRNPYGEALDKLLDKKDYDAKRLKAAPEKVKEELEAAFKKVEEEKGKGQEKTFKERMDAHLLPGGDKEGK